MHTDRETAARHHQGRPAPSTSTARRRQSAAGRPVIALAVALATLVGAAAAPAGARENRDVPATSESSAFLTQMQATHARQPAGEQDTLDSQASFGGQTLDDQIAETGAVAAWQQPSGPDGPVLSDFTPSQADDGSPDADSLTGAIAFDAAGHDPADDYIGGPGCMIQCITSGLAYARGVDAELFVTTHVPAVVTLMVAGPGYARVIGSGVPGYSFSTIFDDLEAHTTYDVLAIAEDAAGFTSQATGSFTTYTRNVTLDFTHADVHSAPWGTAEIDWSIWVNGEWRYSASHEPVGGDFLPIAISGAPFDDVGAELDLAVTLVQYNPDPSDCGTAKGTPGGGPPEGSSNSCGAIGTAWLADNWNDLDDRPASATSWTSHQLERTLVPPGFGGLPTGYGDALDFSVPVTLDVTYTPSA